MGRRTGRERADKKIVNEREICLRTRMSAASIRSMSTICVGFDAEEDVDGNVVHEGRMPLGCSGVKSARTFKAKAGTSKKGGDDHPVKVE